MGWGVTAYLPLPCALAPRRPHAPQQQAHILVVEDNASNRRLLQAVLHSLGHRATLVADGAEAVAMVEQQAFDMILMDINMPGMDGLEAARRIRALPVSWADAPIAALTANCSAGLREQVFDAGMDAFLQKPLEIAKLAAAIARFSRHADGHAALNARPASVDPAELDQIEGQNGQNKDDDQGQGGHKRVSSIG